jgi:pantetheine-phosphate adenylyltransferase
MKTAVFPGSFDPFTLGHESIVRKALPLFDKIVVAIGANSTKNSTFDLDIRTQWIKKTFADATNVDVVPFKGLTVDFCREQNAQFILRGLRNPNDYQYESAIAQMNQALNSDVTTVFLICDPEYAAISSSIVREIHKNAGDVKQFLPKAINLNG